MIMQNFKSVNLKRYIFFVVFILLIFSVFIYQMVKWQVIDTDYYKIQANSSNIYFVNTEAVRGEILDASGEGLAINESGYKVVIDRLLVEQGKENELIINAVKILKKFENEWIDILPISLIDENFCYKQEKESQIENLRSFLKVNSDASAEECIEKMKEKYKISNEVSKENIRILCSVKYNMEKKGVYYSKSTPYVLCDALNKEALAVISEKSDFLKGIRVQVTPIRKYINGDIAPNIVGYTGFMSSEEYKNHKEDYSMDEKIGKTGIEAAFEGFLRGIGGKRMIEMSRDGKIIKISEKQPAKAGNTIFLTISSKLQKVANESLKKSVENAKLQGIPDCKSAAVVVLNVKDFSVLAASSYPSYDLTKFMQDKTYYSELYKNKDLPLLNRAFLGAYAPGSIYKPLVACAALEEGKITSEEKIPCTGSFNYYSGYKLRCMGVHGGANLKFALAKSCNVYFAELGRRLGAENLAFWARKFGLGIKTGIEIGESEGILAEPSHSEKVGAKWYPAGSSQAAIGQSENMFTPLQLAAYVATIANGGKRFRTHLVSKITDYSHLNIIKEYKPELVEETGVSEENLKAVKEGMRQVVLSGTARDFSNFPIPIAAKTGTAQNSGTDHTTFICFAPYENPEVAIAVVVEHGKTGMASKNIARDILNAYFGF